MHDWLYLGEPVAQPCIWVALRVSLPLYNAGSFQSTYFQQYIYFRSSYLGHNEAKQKNRQNHSIWGKKKIFHVEYLRLFPAVFYSSLPVCQQGDSHHNYCTLPTAERSVSSRKSLENQTGGEPWCIVKGDESTGFFLKRGIVAKYAAPGGRWDHGQRKLPDSWIWVCICVSPFLRCFKNTLVQTPSCCYISSSVTARGLHQMKMQSKVCCALCWVLPVLACEAAVTFCSCFIVSQWCGFAECYLSLLTSVSGCRGRSW